MNESHSATSVLSAYSISKYIASSLPRNAEPQLRTATDALAVACHAGLLAVGFRLIGLGEEHRVEAHSEQSQLQALPPQWSETASTIAFRYAHAQSAMEYLLKISKLGPKTLIYGIALGDDKATSFDVTTKDFISEAGLPANPIGDSSKSEDDVLHDIQSIYITPSRLTELGSLLKINIIQKLIPSLQKPGYEDNSVPGSTATTSRDQTQQTPREGRQPRFDDPNYEDPVFPRPAQPRSPPDLPRFQPQRPVPDFAPPGFEDEFELQRPMGGLPSRQPGGPLADYGRADLEPPGLRANDPLRIGPRGGGMHPTIDRFGEEHRSPFDLRRPPGSRWDPVNGEPWDPADRGSGPGPGRPQPGAFGGMGNPFSGFGRGDFI